jgi:hypothetical protein
MKKHEDATDSISLSGFSCCGSDSEVVSSEGGDNGNVTGLSVLALDVEVSVVICVDVLVDTVVVGSGFGAK